MENFLIIISIILLTLIFSIIPIGLCIFASYRAFIEGSLSGYVAILFIIAFVPFVNIFIGYLTLGEYIINQLRKRNGTS